MYYLPPRKNRWALAYLNTPATYPGGARRVKIQVDYGNARYIDGRRYVWTRVTSRTDAHMPFGDLMFRCEDMITDREGSQ